MFPVCVQSLQQQLRRLSSSRMTQLVREHKSPLVDCEEHYSETIAWQIVKARAVARLAPPRNSSLQTTGQENRDSQGNNDMATAPCLDPVSS